MAWLLPASLLLASALLAQSPTEMRLRNVETLLDRHYRGEDLEVARSRVNAQVDAFNALFKTRNQELETAKTGLDQVLAPPKELGAQLADLDQKLRAQSLLKGREAMDKYNALVDQRNAVVARYNELNAIARGAVEVYNERLKQVNEEIAAARARLQADQHALNARSEAYEVFRKQGEDVRMFVEVNRLLAELRTQARSGTAQPLLDKVRAIRRELAAWAFARNARQSDALVLVEAVVLDERCWFILDTGAMQTTLSRELVDALALGDRLGEETTLILAGGVKIQGRRLEIPQITVAGRTETRVSGSAVPPSDVGIDGLLGQSFLKRFIYTIDETRPDVLVLVKR
jgi:hypothetical protein